MTLYVDLTLCEPLNPPPPLLYILPQFSFLFSLSLSLALSYFIPKNHLQILSLKFRSHPSSCCPPRCP